MAFYYSTALQQASSRSRELHASRVFTKSFRLLIWLRATRKVALFPFFLPIYVLWLIIRLLSKALACFGCGNGDFASSSTIREHFLSFVISLAGYDTETYLFLSTKNRITQAWQKAVWQAFWRLYAVLTDDLGHFIEDYCEVLRRQPGIQREFVLFIDHGFRQAIPCSPTIDDKALLQLIGMFYNLLRARGGLFELFGTKSISRIDVIKLEQSYAAGARAGPPLGLGEHGTSSRLIHFFNDPSGMEGRTELMHTLNRHGILDAPRRQPLGLNIVRSLDPYIAGTMVMIPMLFSLLVSIIWASVASAYYDTELNTSTQTGFTIGSYVVTAGM